MSDDTRIEIELVLNNSGVDKPLKDQEKKFAKSGKDSGDKFNKGFNAGIGPLKAIVAGIGSALVGAFAVGKVVAAAKTQEDAVNQLNASLRNMGAYTPQLSQELQNYAASLQAATVHGDEAIIQQMAFAQAMGASVEKSKQIVAAAADMSAALNVDFNSAVRNISKTLGGLSGELGEVIPELKGLTQEQMKAGAGVDLLAAKYAGFANSQVNTFSGAVSQLSNTFGDLMEEIGNLIIKSPALVGVFKFVSKAIMDAMESVKGFGSQGDVMKPIIMGIISFADAINTFIVAPLELAYNGIKFILNGVSVLLNGYVAGWGKILGKIADMANSAGIENGLTEGLQAFRDSSQAVLDEAVTGAQDSFDKMFDFNIADKSATFLEGLSASVEGAKAITEEGGNSMKQALQPDESLLYTWDTILAGISQTMTTFEGKVKDFSSKIGKMLMQGLGASAANAFAALGAAAAKGENMLQAFLNSMLQSMGQMAIQLGSMFILEGLAMMWAGLPNGPALIGAGAALAAFGGIMGAIGGGKGGASGSGGGVAVAEPGTSSGNPTFTDPSAAQARQEPQTNVTLNVQGDILDSEETGSRLVTLLNDNFESKGGRLVGGFA